MAFAPETPGSSGWTSDISRTSNGWLTFASLMVCFAGIWNVIQGFLGFFRPSTFHGHTVAGPLWVWALLWMVFGVVQIAAAGAIFSHRSWGRWFAIVTAALNTFLSLLAMDLYPGWQFPVIAIDLMVLFALTVRWRRAPAT